MSQKSESQESDKWQIRVLYDVENQSSLMLTVTKDCFTGELFEKLRQHPKAPQTNDFELISISGSIRGALKDNWEERLSDYDLTDRSAIALVARLLGGGWPTRKEVEAEQRHLKPADGITLTTISKNHPDVCGVEDDGPGVIMRCGHATTPMMLALFCLSELEHGEDEIRCPACNAKWKFALLRPAACLTENEITEFEQRAHLNYFRNHQSAMNTCPGCGTFSSPYSAHDKRVVCTNCTSRSGEPFEFCWTCLGLWKTPGNEICGNPKCGSNKEIFEILGQSETKMLNGVEVPSRRACPNCSSIIHHDDGCKHMTCGYCRYEFCFICLKKYPCETDVFEPCAVAPCQTSDTKFMNSSDVAEDQTDGDTESSTEDETDDDAESPSDDVDVSSLTIGDSESAVSISDAAIRITMIGSDSEDKSRDGIDDTRCTQESDGDVAQLKTNIGIVQSSNTLGTEKILSYASMETSGPAARRSRCVTQ